MRWLLLLVVVLCAGIVIGVCVERHKQSDRQSITISTGDTVTLTDTVREVVPVPVASAGVRRDTVWMPSVATDTVFIRDSVQVVVPIEQKVYADSIYTAWVSGYRPALDSIEIYSRERIITNTIETTKWKHKRWHLGISAGYGWTIEGFRPYMGVGITYSIVDF